MSRMNADPLPVYIRGWAKWSPPETKGKTYQQLPAPPWPRSDYVLIFDTETTTDEWQSLNFGAFLFCRWGADDRLEIIQEGLFFADDLQKRSPSGFAELRRYAREHDFMLMTAERFAKKLTHPRIWCSRADFVHFIFYVLAYGARSLVAGFNLPFDISRLAVDWGSARKSGAFWFSLYSHIGKDDKQPHEHLWHPRIQIEHVNNKLAFINFQAARKIDSVDRIPENSADGQPAKDYVFPGHFLDLRTFVWVSFTTSFRPL